MTLGGRRVQVRRPRMRTADDERELPVETLRVLRRPRPADPGGDGPDARRRLDAQVRAGRRAGRQEVEAGSRSTSKTSVSEMFVERTATALAELMSPPAGRRAAGGDDARRAGDRRAHACRRARDHHRGRQDPARALGRLDRERHAGAHAAGRPGRPRPRSRAGDPVRDRRRARRCGGRSRTSSASTRSCTAATATRSATSAICCPSATATRSAPGCGRPGAHRSELARQRLELLAGELDRPGPTPPRSLREGMDDTLTLMRLGITGKLAKTLCSTNPCEA